MGAHAGAAFLRFSFLPSLLSGNQLLWGKFAPLLEGLHCLGKQTGGPRSYFLSINDVSIHINTAANHFRAFSC